MKRIPNTLGSLNNTRRTTFQKFIVTDSSAIKQRSILLQLNDLHKFLCKQNIIHVRKRSQSSTDQKFPPMDDIFNLHLQQMAILDRTHKTYNLTYHASLHNQMTKVLFLALFDGNDKVVQKIISSGYPSAIFQKCLPIYLYFCAIGNRDLLSSVSYRSSPFFGLGASILCSFKGFPNLKHIDFDFMTVKQFLLLNEYRGINTVDKKLCTHLIGSSGFSSDSSYHTSISETDSSENCNDHSPSDLQSDELRNSIDHRVLFPLDFLCIRNDFRAVEALLQHSADFAPLSTFCFLLQCHAGITLRLLQYRVNPNQSFRGYTPLHVACRLGNLDVTSIFIALKADLDAKDFFGRTPMYYAKLYKNTKVIELLELSRKKKLLPYITTDNKYINYEIFDDEAFKERLKLTKEHLKRAMSKQYNRRFTIVSLFSVGTDMRSSQNHMMKLKEWRSDQIQSEPSQMYRKFKLFLAENLYSAD